MNCIWEKRIGFHRKRKWWRDRKGGPSGDQNGTQIKARRKENRRHKCCP